MAGASPVQTQEDIVPPAPAAIGYRLAGVLLAPPVALAMHLVLVGPFALTLQVPAGPGSSGTQELSLLTTALFTLGIAVAGWISVMALTAFLGDERGRKIWTTVAFAVFVVSIIPIAVIDNSLGAKWGLFALHLAVAVVLIPTLSSGTRAEPLDRG
jgi:MFS family permease